VKNRSLRYSVMAFSLLGTLAGLTGCRFLGGPPKANSPIKVRGGAMTFRSTTQWQPVSGQVAYYLDNANVSYISFTGVDPVGSAPPGPLYPPGCWTMTLVGRNPNPSVVISNGITITALTSSCNHPTTYHSLTLTGFGNGSFYPEKYKPDDDGTYSERYMDTTPDVPTTGTTAAVPGCQGPSGLGPTLTGDEDFCERLSKITLILYTGATPGTPSTYKCKNGDCEIDIGQ
jgi:hypothetical protein